MLSYTKATLKEALTTWNRNSAPEFVDTLDEIIKRGELNLLRALDIEPMIDENDTSTNVLTGEVFKPDNLIVETEVWITVDDVRTPVLKRGRAWVKMMGDTAGTPLYYCERDTTRWTFGPPADDTYLVEVTGQYAPDSIADGDDDGVTYFSTVVPDLLYVACAIEANTFLKFWANRDALLEEFAAKVAMYKGEAPNQESTQIGDKLGDRQQANPVKPPGA